MFPAVATLEAYAPVAARLAEEHLDIHAHLERVDDLALAVRSRPVAGRRAGQRRRRPAARPRVALHLRGDRDGRAARPAGPRASRRSAVSGTRGRRAVRVATVGAWARSCGSPSGQQSIQSRHPSRCGASSSAVSCTASARERGERLVDVAERAGVSMQYLSEVERGPQGPVVGDAPGDRRRARPGRARARHPRARARRRSPSPPDRSGRTPASAPARAAPCRRCRSRRPRRPGGRASGRCPAGSAPAYARCARRGSPPAAGGPGRPRRPRGSGRARCPGPGSRAGGAPPGRAAGSRGRRGAPPASSTAAVQVAWPTHTVSTARPDELHGVVDREHRVDRAAGRVDVEADRAARGSPTTGGAAGR